MWKVVVEALKRRKERVSNGTTASTRPSWGAQIFNRMMIMMGVRSPFKKLLPVDASAAQTVKHFIDKFRIYSLILVGFYCVMPIYHGINLYETYSDAEFINFLSECLVPIQLALACRYFSTSHIEQYYDVIKPLRGQKRALTTNITDIYIDIRQENKDKNVEFSVLIKQPCRITLRVVTIIVIFLSIVVFSGSMATTDFSDFSAPFIPFMILSRLMGRATVVNNTTTFCYVFYKHVKVLNIYAKG